MKILRIDKETDKLIENGKKWESIKVLNKQKKIHNNLKSQVNIYYKTMLSYCLKSKRSTESKNP